MAGKYQEARPTWKNASRSSTARVRSCRIQVKRYSRGGTQAAAVGTNENHTTVRLPLEISLAVLTAPSWRGYSA
jgi:hypothetical protein